jgi:hypothetical protein
MLHDVLVLSPASLPLVVRHFDCLDQFVADKLVGVRPWNEPGLTSLLCDLLDDRTQAKYRLDYPVSALRADLAATEPLLDIDFTIETHEYDPAVERWVTQSDLGVIISYVDRLVPTRSFERAWLLQAKRLYPWPDGHYDEASTFRATDKGQAARVRRLNELLDFPFVRYLLYCPRPSDLDPRTAAVLGHVRDAAVSDEIFDYAFGLAVRDALMRDPATLSAGLFITDGFAQPSAFMSVHAGLLQSHDPLAWFVVRNLTDAWNGPPQVSRRVATPDIAIAIARGLPSAVDSVRDQLDVGDRPFRFLPAHTLTIRADIDARDADRLIQQ